MEYLYKNFLKNMLSFKEKNSKITNFIVGYSTGPDSTLLLKFLKKYLQEEKEETNLIAAHIFHDWGSLNKNFSEKQIERKDFAIEFCKNENIKLEIFDGDINLFLKNGNGSLEATGRYMRKFYFDYLLEKYENSVIILGHNEDEQIETFFIKLFRGTSLNGLSCMQIYENKIFRPLLKIKKSEILNYLNNNKIDFCVDESNLDNSFLRGKIRNYLIPALKKTDIRFEKNIIKTIENLNESKNFLEKTLEEKIKVEDSILIEDFKNYSNYLKKEFILNKLYKLNFINEKISSSLINEIIRFIENKKSKEHSVLNLKIKKLNKKIFFEKIK